jgi:hypothetical protein
MSLDTGVVYTPTSNDVHVIGDNFIPVLCPGDLVVHTPENPFCDDFSCPCHDDPEAIALVNQAYQDGLITADHATDIVMGRRPW